MNTLIKIHKKISENLILKLIESDRIVDPLIVARDPGEDVWKSGLGTSGSERSQSCQIPTAVLHVAV